jgi:hypothetical protein
MSVNFLDILLEAKGDPAKKKITVDLEKDKSTTDYSADAPADAPEDDTTADNNNADDGTSQDYTKEDTEVDPEANQDDATDYGNDENAPTDDAGDGTDNGDGADGDDTTDYTDDGSGGGDNPDEQGGDDTSNEDPAEDPEEVAEKLDNRRLLTDYTNFYYMNKGIINKLSAVNRSDLLINKVINQVKINLSELQKQVYDYIIYQFPTGKYVKNLYSYNYFIEAFRINVQMLKKISVLSSNE